MMRVSVLVALTCVLSLGAVIAAASKPNIIFILIDDLGWNDVSMHGSTQIPTPNIDSIKEDGMGLFQYRVNPVCSPTRTSLMSGRSVLSTGTTEPYDFGQDVAGLNLSYTLLPEQLNRAGYSSVMIGKWHCGMKNKQYLPSARGFEKYLGFYTSMNYGGFGRGHYADGHYNVRGKAMHIGGTALGYQPGQDAVYTNDSEVYSTQLFAEYASKWIHDHADTKKNSPLFLYLCFQGIHSANSKYIQAPKSYVDKFKYISPNETCDPFELTRDCSEPAARRTVAGATSAVDDGIGTVLEALKATGMWDDSLVVVSTDNGGPTDYQDANMASNLPLRGGKNTYWEGGIRGVGAVRGPGIPKLGWNHELMHVTDWYHTFLEAAGVTPSFKPNEPPLNPTDGVSQWKMLTEGAPSARDEIVHLTQPTASLFSGSNALTASTSAGLMKVVWNAGSPNSWPATPGIPANYSGYVVDCGGPPPTGHQFPQCTKAEPCLFNISSDPCEFKNLADEMPEELDRLKARLAYYSNFTVYPWMAYDGGVDPRGNPINFPGPGYNASWQPYLTDEEEARYYPTNYTVPPHKQPPMPRETSTSA